MQRQLLYSVCIRTNHIIPMRDDAARINASNSINYVNILLFAIMDSPQVLDFSKGKNRLFKRKGGLDWCEW